MKTENKKQDTEEVYLNQLIDEANKEFSLDRKLAKKVALKFAKWQAERSNSEAIEFAEWIRIKDLQTTSKDNWIGLDMKYYTTEELFEQFKK